MIEPVIELVSACYLIVIIIGISLLKDERSASTKAYIYCCWACLAGLIIDAVLYVPVEPTVWLQSDLILTLVAYLSYVLIDVLLAAYSYYQVTLIKEQTGRFSRRMPWVMWGLCALDAAFLTVGTITGRLFAVVNQQPIIGPWMEHASKIPTVIMIVVVYYLLKNSKVISFRNLVVLSVYFILQMLVAVLWLFNITVISGYAAFALSLSVIFVMIQFRIISEANMRAEILITLSVRDDLTGLNNRRAYDACLSDISPEADVCAVFCDVNSLKTVNDTMGHAEGDKLIKKMADVLREAFADEEIFRISGDEFVVILQNEEEVAISEKIVALKQAILENDKIASVGYDTGKGSNILGVINDAEQMMYSAKAAYYKETGKDRRS